MEDNRVTLENGDILPGQVKVPPETEECNKLKENGEKESEKLACEDDYDEDEEDLEYLDVVGRVKEVLINQGLVDQVNGAFAKCKNDYDRFKTLFTNKVIYDAIDADIEFKAKNVETAMKYRQKGNEFFKNKKYGMALESYSLCVVHAPLPEGTENSELALGYANRSAVLYHLSEYTLAIQDITLALKYNYPANLKYKVYDRLGRSYYHTRHKDEAVQAFEDAIDSLDEAELDKGRFKKVEADLFKQLIKARKITGTKIVKNVKDFNQSRGVMPKLSKPSKEVPCMESHLVIKYSPDRGRGVYTTQDIEAGELLLIEQPYSSITSRDYELSHCNYCQNRTFAPLPCDKSSAVVYCSEECKTAAWNSFHFAEWSISQRLHRAELGLGRLALRMVLKNGIQNIIENCERYKKLCTSDILRLGFTEDGVYDSLNYDAVYTLVNHSERRPLGDLFRRTVHAVFLVKCLEKSLKVPDEHIQLKCIIGSHILRNIQMLPCNAHEVSEFAYRVYDLPNSHNVEVGSAIYATLSLINHSCDPNVVRHSYGDFCAVRAIRNIPKGTELYDNYGALYPIQEKQMRCRKLSDQYHFKCCCRACVENWPLYHDIPSEIPYFYCEKCNGNLCIPEDGKTQRAMCDKCRYVQDMTPKLDVWTRSDEIFAKKLKEVVSGEVTMDALDVLLDHLRVLDRLIVRPFADYNDCQEAVKQCLNLKANCKKVDLYRNS